MHTKRSICSACLRPSTSCICNLACSISNNTDVLILQHPLEQKNAKGTARLLQLSLSHCRIVVGETFSPDTLTKLLSEDRLNMLLYPSEAESIGLTLDELKGISHEPKPLRLIILDGTWRKSRKLLHCNPILKSLPRLTLDSNLEGQYHIRKAHKIGQLSTLEACCAALTQLENLDLAPLKTSFDNFIQRLQYQAQQGRAISGTIANKTQKP